MSNLASFDWKRWRDIIDYFTEAEYPVGSRYSVHWLSVTLPDRLLEQGVKVTASQIRGVIDTIERTSTISHDEIMRNRFPPPRAEGFILIAVELGTNPGYFWCKFHYLNFDQLRNMVLDQFQMPVDNGEVDNGAVDNGAVDNGVVDNGVDDGRDRPDKQITAKQAGIALGSGLILFIAIKMLTQTTKGD